ncbi:MAG: hypothetical protein HY719_06205 [Planctomycetes bacterium]|nr:hypothetical protein [Planctomycetota bacterium]
MPRDSIELTLPLATPPAFASWLARYRGLLASRLLAFPVAPLPPEDRLSQAAPRAVARTSPRADHCGGMRGGATQ